MSAVSLRRPAASVVLSALWLATVGLAGIGAMTEYLGQDSFASSLALLCMVAVAAILLASAFIPVTGLSGGRGLVVWLGSFPFAASVLRVMLGLPAANLFDPRHASDLGFACGVVLATTLVIAVLIRCFVPRPIETALAAWPRSTNAALALVLMVAAVVIVRGYLASIPDY